MTLESLKIMIMEDIKSIFRDGKFLIMLLKTMPRISLFCKFRELLYSFGMWKFSAFLMKS